AGGRNRSGRGLRCGWRWSGSQQGSRLRQHYPDEQNDFAHAAEDTIIAPARNPKRQLFDAAPHATPYSCTAGLVAKVVQKPEAILVLLLLVPIVTVHAILLK